MTYEQWIDDIIFTEHHLAMGMDLDEIQELIEDSTFNQRLKWLSKNGYDVSKHEYYNQIS